MLTTVDPKNDPLRLAFIRNVARLPQRSTRNLMESQPPPGLTHSFTNQQLREDESHLKALSICYYVLGGLSFAGILFLGLHALILLGLMGSSFAGGSSSAAAPLVFMGFFYLIGFVILIALGLCNIFCGKCLVQRRNKLFVQIIAGLNCLNMPLGTALGAFTFIVLTRPSVSTQFDSTGPLIVD